MKILNRQQFLALPAGVIFSKYDPCIFEAFCIKGNTIDIYNGTKPEYNDFCFQQISDSLDRESALKLPGTDNLTTDSYNFDFDCMSRDGLHYQNQLFAVWEPNDVKQLIMALQELPVVEINV